MPQFNSDLIPETSGRNLGSEDKRWDAKLRNIDFTGSLTGAGLRNWIINNPTPNTETLHLESDTGTGGSLVRMIVANGAGSDRIITSFKNSLIEIGSALDADGGITPLMHFAGNSDTEPFASYFRRGSLGVKAAEIDANGTFKSYASGYTPYAFTLSVWGDAQPQLLIADNGSLQWGPGGAGSLDAGIARQSSGVLQINNAQGGYANLHLEQLICNIADGTPPLQLNSRTKVTNLNADLLDGSDWSAPPAIGSVTPGTAVFSSLNVQGQIQASVATGTPPLLVGSSTPVPNLTVSRVKDCVHDGIINENGEAIKVIKALTGNVSPGARAIIHMVFPTPFPTADYAVSLSIFDSLNPTTLGLRIHRITAQETTNVDIQVQNDSSTEARSGVVHVVAFRTS
jgi:hypothetical protein